MSNANTVRVTRLAMKESDANRASAARNERDDTRAIKITTVAAVVTHQWWKSENRDMPTVCVPRPPVDLGQTIERSSDLDVTVYE
jgi:hypothetical protein